MTKLEKLIDAPWLLKAWRRELLFKLRRFLNERKKIVVTPDFDSISPFGWELKTTHGRDYVVPKKEIIHCSTIWQKGEKHERL